MKICGVTSVEDAEAAVAAGADMLGLNFVAGSARKIDNDVAQRVAASLRDECEIVCVFADAAVSTVKHVLDYVEPDLLQFHGDEDNEYCKQFDVKFLKVFDMSVADGYDSQVSGFDDAYVHLLDSGKGGTGETFDWSTWPRNARANLMLAGGLDPDNVHQAVVSLKPWGVDVASGVEEKVKGIKNVARMRAFVQEVRRADNE